MGIRANSRSNPKFNKVVLNYAELEGEVVVHFRWASVGGIDADLCHPFPVTRAAKTDLFGSAEAVLFQNGTWSAYDEALRRLAAERGRRLPSGPMSDTRAAALCAREHGRRILGKLPGRWVWMDRERTRLYGRWESFRGMRASNLHFVRRLPLAEVPARREPEEDAPALLGQPELWDCGSPQPASENGATTREPASSLPFSPTLNP